MTLFHDNDNMVAYRLVAVRNVQCYSGLHYGVACCMYQLEQDEVVFLE